MSSAIVRSPASANLLATYRKLAAAVPGAVYRTYEGFVASQGPYRDPVCNYAAELDLNPWRARELARVASMSKTFHVYRLPEDQPTSANEILTSNGFEERHRLIQMQGEEPPARFRTLPIREARSVPDRALVSRFIAEQFFSAQPSSFRYDVASATSQAESLRLFYFLEGSQIAGSVMLCEEAGVVGVYNLCVRPSLRGSGRGRALAAWCLNYAAERGRNAVLQCEPRLEPWYGELGFVSTGSVQAFGLAPDAASRYNILEVACNDWPKLSR